MLTEKRNEVLSMMCEGPTGMAGIVKLIDDAEGPHQSGPYEKASAETWAVAKRALYV